MEQHYSIRALSERWDVPEKTVRSWLDQGRLRRTKLAGRVVIAESEAARFMAESAHSEAKKLATAA